MARFLQRQIPALNSFIKRAFSRTTVCHGLDEDSDLTHMKTTVNIINQEKDEGIFFDAFSNIGFRLNSGIKVVGPCAAFPRSILHWNVRGIDDVSEASLCLFTIMEPKIDILVLGVGERENLANVNPEIIRYLRSKRINIEMLATDQALSTFNFLNSEKRYVAGAFIPPSYVEDSYQDEAYMDQPDDYSLFKGLGDPTEDPEYKKFYLQHESRDVMTKFRKKIGTGKELRRLGKEDIDMDWLKGKTKEGISEKEGTQREVDKDDSPVQETQSKEDKDREKKE